MTEPTPDPEHDVVEENEPMPRWVPIAIGVVLVTLAILAVVTGLRYRRETLTRVVHPSRVEHRPTAPAPPGEPEPGGSLVSGSEPTAGPAVTGPTRAVVTNGPGGVSAQVRIWASRGMVLNVLPDDAEVYVNNIPIGQANQFNTPDEVYDFPEPGSYTVRILAPGYREQQYVVTATPDSKNEIARISASLQKE